MAKEKRRWEPMREEKWITKSEMTESEWSGDFQFVQLADCQFGFFESDEDGGKDWTREVDQSLIAIRYINQLKPKFVVMCGDMTQAYPSQKYYLPQVSAFKEVYGQIDPNIPLICVCGNHDVGDIPSSSTLKQYRSNFGKDFYSFFIGGCFCIVLNASLFGDPSNVEGEQERQMKWFEAELERVFVERGREEKEGEEREGREEEEKNGIGVKHIFVFMHQPWFLKRGDEKDLLWFDVLDLDPSIPLEVRQKILERAKGKGKYVNIPRVRREPALQLLSKAKVTASFGGHLHKNFTSHFEANGSKMEMIVNSAIGKPLGIGVVSGLRVVDVQEDSISHKFIGLSQL